MKKNNRLTFIIVFLVILLMLCKTGASLSLSAKSEGSVSYTNEATGVSFTDTLSAAEVQAVVSALDGKVQYTGKFAGIPTENFREDVTITIGERTFALACDDTLAVKNLTEGMYIDLEAADRAALEDIFTSRGGTFPVE